MATRPTLDPAQIFDLLRRVALHDEAAFRELYRAYSRKVYAYVLNQVRDPAKAEEIVSDTLYHVWQNPSAFRGDARFDTWLIGIARNKVLHAWRDRAKPGADHDDVDEYAETIEDEGPGVFDSLAERQRRDGVAQCLDKLPDDQRECMHLTFYEGYSVAEIAATQGCPEGTVKTRLFHARARIKTCLRLLLEREGEVAAK